MAQMPIEIAEIGEMALDELRKAVQIANAVQNDFIYVNLVETNENVFSKLSYRRATTDQLMSKIEEAREGLRGYHPFIVAFVDSEFDGNLFGSTWAKKGVAVVTTHNVETLIIPKGRMSAYFLYYLARCTTKFLVPTHRNHTDTRECMYDLMLLKTDILKSMRANSICDTCREKLLSINGGISSSQLQSINQMLEAAGKLLNNEFFPQLQSEDALSERTQVDQQSIETIISYCADHDTKRFFGLCFGFIFLFFLGLAFLVISLGWDVIEPWTYFLGIVAPIISYFYFALTQKEWTPSAIYQSYLQRRIMFYKGKVTNAAVPNRPTGLAADAKRD